MQDWDDAFANGAYIPGADAYFEQWTDAAAAFRAGVNCARLSYGTHDREVVDLILPDGPPKGLMIFVHGGYWMRTAPSDWTHLAAGAHTRGWAVALPGYRLAPNARIAQITAQIGAAIRLCAGQVDGPIALTGHSAGGHLVARMVSETSPLPDDISARITHCLPISGIFDLRPLMWTQMNDTLQLDVPEARTESPVLLRPKGTPRVSFWVGAEERPEFLRQNHLMAMMWAGLGADVSEHTDPGHHHFSVIEGLSDPDSEIMAQVLR